MAINNENNKSTDEENLVLDDYMAKLWSYDLDEPQMGMRPKEELRQLFFKAEFDFNPGAYQAGELSYLSYYGTRLLYSMVAEKTQAENERRQAEEEGRTVLQSDEEIEADKQKEELLKVTQNRLTFVHKGLREWINRLEGIYYYKSKFTGAPYIDGKGRVFLFILDDSIKKAEEVASNSADFDLAYTDDVKKLSETLYLNASEVIIVNDGVMPFEASRVNLLPTPALEASPEQDKTPDINREIRFFILSFHQVVLSPVRSDDNEEQRRMALLQLEAQISSRLLQTSAYFTNNSTDEEQLSLVMVEDEKGNRAISCFIDKESKPANDDKFTYKKLPFFSIAANVLRSIDAGDNSVQGIVLNPGTLNFYMDIEWLKRMSNFAKHLAEQNQEHQNN